MRLSLFLEQFYQQSESSLVQELVLSLGEVSQDGGKSREGGGGKTRGGIQHCQSEESLQQAGLQGGYLQSD